MGALVGRSVGRSPLVDLLSHWSGAVYFWTWKQSSASMVELTPYTGKAPALGAKRTQLKGLLHHLPWQDMAAAEETEADPKAIPF